ncbi:hypothetical protein [Plantactinospora sp. BB1]|uniref:hypothetical protein n=1 Tax=Plantactinospora sp. BB1 TaxID=2071627 RepID=UPI00131F224C|nr:hypothetical protein [Plantactinospora sp. BB1]
MPGERPSPSDILNAARRVIRAHQEATCPACTPDGCPADEWAAVTLFEDAVAAAPRGSKTLDDVRRIADRIRSGIDRAEMAGGVDRAGPDPFE